MRANRAEAAEAERLHKQREEEERQTQKQGTDMADIPEWMENMPPFYVSDEYKKKHMKDQSDNDEEDDSYVGPRPSSPYRGGKIKSPRLSGSERKKTEKDGVSAVSEEEHDTPTAEDELPGEEDLARYDTDYFADDAPKNDKSDDGMEKGDSDNRDESQ